MASDERGHISQRRRVPRLRPVLGGLCAALALACPLGAEERRGPAEVLAATGWLGYGPAPRAGSASCTATLIAPDLILTADHCLMRMKTHEVIAPATIRFILEQGSGPATPARRGVASWVASLSPAEGATGDTGYDIGLLRITPAFTPDEARPLPLASVGTDFVTPFLMVGYPISAPDRPVVREPCIPAAVDDRHVGFDCPVEGGFSGGPVAGWNGTEWQLIAVVVAAMSGDGAVKSAARILPPPADLLAALPPARAD